MFRLLTFSLLLTASSLAQTPQLRIMDRLESSADAPNEAMFFLSFGEKTGQPSDWTGEVNLSQCELEALEPYKFDNPDKLLPPNGWSIAKREEPILRKTIYYTDGYQGEPSAGVVITVLEQPGCSIEVATTRGNFTFKPSDFQVGERQPQWQGDASVTRLPVARLMGSAWWADDFPSIAADRTGGLWVAWSAYHADRDEIGLRAYRDGKWSNYMPVPGNKGDAWLPQVLIDHKNDPWVLFAQQVDENWDLYQAHYQVDANRWVDVDRITDHPLTDTNHSAVVGDDGDIYLAWQALRGHNFDIHLKVRDSESGKWSREYVVSNDPGNDWEPSIALDSSSRAWVAWDSYRNGNYDIYLRSFEDGEMGEEIAVARTARLDKRARVTVDKQDRVWIAWEQGDPGWGKDIGFIEPQGGGSALGGHRWLQVAVWDGSKLLAPKQQPDQAAIVGSGSFQPRLFQDANGNMGVLSYRRMHNRKDDSWWEQQFSFYSGDKWTTPTQLPLSWSRPDATNDVTVASDGTLWFTYSSDTRNYPYPHRPFEMNLYAAHMPSPATGPTPELQPLSAPPIDVTPSHADEPADVASIRAYRTNVDGRELRIIRGDTHRHTDMSWDGGGTTDGSFSEFWRYMIDAADMDWGNVSDHQGGGTYMDYFWWLQGKAADMHNMPGRYTAMYGYERGMVQPDGHRNIVSATRSLAPLPFLRKVNFGPERNPAEIPPGANNMADNDVKFLYKSLKQQDAFALSHTSATHMGTNWRDNDPAVEPVVEIYQGARMNYEYIGAPRAVGRIVDGKPDRETAAGTFFPEGYVNHAWAKGYRLGVVASSDHNSTHMSYAMVYTDDTSRSGVVAAVKRRQTYAATDNIILDVRMGKRFMGSDFSTSELPPLDIFVRGTKNVAKITILRDQKVIHVATPQSREAKLSFQDNEAGTGEHYYYVRIEQSDGELAWSSPIWVKLL